MAAVAGDAPTGVEPARLDRALLAWLGVGVLVLVLFYLSAHIPFLNEIPEAWFIPLADWVNAVIDWFLATFRWFFRAVTAVLEVPLGWVRDFLKWLPWPAMLIAVGAIGFAAGGWRLAAFTTPALAYMVVIGYWDKTAATLSMAAIAVPISLGAGLVIGIVGHRSARARRAIDPMLDLMQTIPTFAYLVPILVLFGVGPVVGILASAIYAIPPMVRNVMLGLERVPTEIVESATMSGSTGRQLLWWVKIPVAMPTILMGVNQTTMATLGMVVIAAMLGGIDDIGLEVFIMMKRAAFGESLLAGLVIALVAMILDRISRGFVDRSMDARIAESDSPYRRQLLLGALASVILVSVLAQFLPGIKDYPKAWVWYPADHLNNALNWFTNEFFEVTSAIKTWAIFFFSPAAQARSGESSAPEILGFRAHLDDQARVPSGDDRDRTRRRAPRQLAGRGRGFDRRVHLLLRHHRDALAGVHFDRGIARFPGRRLAGMPARDRRSGVHRLHRHVAARDDLDPALRRRCRDLVHHRRESRRVGGA